MSIDRLVGGPHRTVRSVTARGRIAKAPTSAAADLTVVLTNYSAAYEYEVPSSNWQQGITLPVAGDPCLVLFDDDGDAWVPVWGS